KDLLLKVYFSQKNLEIITLGSPLMVIITAKHMIVQPRIYYEASHPLLVQEMGFWL
ncbi:hypothetical protein ACH5RR_018570, partial [Cinchona calisaya]